jgi:hypothetical protein
MGPAAAVSANAMTSTRVWRLIAVGFLLFLVLVALCADTQRIPGLFRALCDYPGGDKVGHFGLYGMCAFLGAKAWRRPLCFAGLAWPVGMLPAALLATVEETSQLFFPCRSADWLDLGAGFAGIAVATVLATGIESWKPHLHQTDGHR